MAAVARGSTLTLLALAAAVSLAGCTDVFLLPYGDGLELGFTGGDASGGEAGTGGDLSGTDGAVLPLAPSCARLGCVPSFNEGDVTLSSGTISGCHAYATLTIDTPGVKVGADPSGIGFSACADRIVINGFLVADGAGFPAHLGPGAGGPCGAGGSHGGAGADPAGCGGGGVYDDPMTPRLYGSGGGGSGAGDGGGAIELQAAELDVLGVITANGGAGGGPSAGGGSGGSVLLNADVIKGAAKVYARGGLGFGIAGGGGGGGRIASYSGAANALSTDVKGGATTNGSASGANGTIVQMP